MTISKLQVAVRFPLWVAGIAITGAAHTATRSTLDLTAGVGASTNPSLRIGGRGSAFGRFSALGIHEWRSERTITSISLFGENTTYLKGYGSKQIFDLKGHSVHQVSPNVSIFGDLGFQGDFGGQLSSRFATVTPDLKPTPPDRIPPSVILDDPTFIGFGGRQYRLSAQGGLSVRATARSSIALSAGVQRNFASGRLSNINATDYFGNASYDYTFNERTSAGLGVHLQYQDYDNGRSASVLNPYVSVRHRFSDEIDGTATAGLLLTRQKLVGGGSATSVNPSFSFNLCRTNSHERLCGRASRDVRNSFGLGSGASVGLLGISTSAGLDYSRKLDANQSVQLALTATHYSTRVSSANGTRSTYLIFLAGYDRKIRQRLSVGVNGGVRKLILSGLDPKTDFNTSAYVRYRLGDPQ